VDPAASAGACRTEPPSLHWLRALYRLIGTCCIVCALSTLGVCAIPLPGVFLVLLGVFAFSLFLIALSCTAYLAIVFLFHSRYSLQTMMIVVLVLGLAVSFLVGSSPVLKVLGGLMLFGLAMEVLFAVQQFDPLQGTDSRQVPRRGA